MLVYVVTNLLTGKQYVGQTTRSLRERWYEHCKPKDRKTMPISNAIGRYGKEHFEIRELEVCDSIEEMYAAELKWALELDTFVPKGYNLKAGEGPGTMSELTKQKIAASHIGKKASIETRRKLSEARKQYKASPEVLEKMRERGRLRGMPPGIHAACVAKISKTYTVLSPDGVEMTITNMNAHCRKYGLLSSGMAQVISGKYTHHKGWKVLQCHGHVLTDDQGPLEDVA